MIEVFATQDSKEFDLILKKWSVLKELKYILAIPYRATISLQKRDLTLSDLYGIWSKMEIHINACCNQPSKFKTKLPKELMKAVTNRKEKLYSNPFMGCALYLDPRYRRQIANNPEKMDEVKEILLNLWYRIEDDSNKPTNETEKNVSVGSNSSIDFTFDEQAEFDKFLSINQLNIPEEMCPQIEDIEMLITIFDPEPIKPNQTILNYWENAKQTHPQMYKLAVIIFAIPPTETQIERDFSQLDYIFNSRRCGLTKERLEDIMLLNLNPDFFYAVKEEEITETEKDVKKKLF